jgi:hypothetical protein
MLFYTALLIASLILVLALLWLYRMVVEAAQNVCRTGLPNMKQASTAHLNEIRCGRNLKGASKAWGRKPHSTPANLARTHPAKPGKTAPWGWPGNTHEVHEHHSQVAATKGATLDSYLARNNFKGKTTGGWKQNTGHPIGANRSGLSGQAYQPSQEARSSFAIDKRSC